MFNRSQIARLRSCEGQRSKAHVVATHAYWVFRSYLLLVLQTVNSVYIDDSYIVSIKHNSKY